MEPNAAARQTSHSPCGGEDEFRAFFELAGVGNAVVDVHSRRFVRVNRRFETITGYSADELCLLTFGDITHPDDRVADDARFHELIAGAQSEVSMEKRYIRKDGRVIWVHLTTTLVRGADGSARLQIGVVNDITAQREAQASVRALQRDLQSLIAQRTAALADKTAQLESFIYIMAHDLRAPLRAINGYAEFVGEDSHTQLSAEGVSYLERIKKAARRMDGLIRDLLSYSRTAQVELPVENVPLGDAVDRALTILGDEIRRRDAEVVVESPLPTVRAERTALEQVITHVVANAVKFVAPAVRPRVTIRAEERGTTIKFSVSDNGIGIAPEYHERVFRVFERLESARGYPGTGIGLPIVRKTIERLGGRVGLESVPGRGSTFWFELKAGTL